MKKRILSFLITFCMIFTLIPVFVHAITPSITGNSVYRESAAKATVRFLSDTDGTCYYTVNENPTATLGDLALGINAGTVTANTTKSFEISSLTSGAKYVHTVVRDDASNSLSNILNISMPYDVYYFDDFEAYTQDTLIPTKSSNITNSTPQMYIKYNGGNSNNQKVILSGDKKILQTNGTISTGLDIRTDLPSTKLSGIAVFEADITPISFFSGWYNAGLILGEDNTENRAINIAIENDSGEFVAQPLGPGIKQDSEIVCTHRTLYHTRIEIDLTNQKYDYYIDGVKANNSGIPFSCQNLSWFGIYNGSGVANFDNVKFYATPSTHTITYNANGGSGKMTPGAAADNTAFTLPENSFTPPLGKKFKEWAIGSIDGIRVAAGSSHVFTNPTTVYAIWENNTYEISKAPTENGSFTVTKGISEITSAVRGEIITITPAPAEEYKVKTIKILKASDNSDITNSVDYDSENITFTMPDYAVKIFAEFEKIETNQKSQNNSVAVSQDENTNNEKILFMSTGDTSPLYLYVLIIIVSGASFTVLKSSKKKI